MTKTRIFSTLYFIAQIVALAVMLAKGLSSLPMTLLSVVSLSVLFWGLLRGSKAIGMIATLFVVLGITSWARYGGDESVRIAEILLFSMTLLALGGWWTDRRADSSIQPNAPSN